MVKRLRITLVGIGLRNVGATVTLARERTWSASAAVVVSGATVEHSLDGHASERDALVAIAEWLRHRFGARTTCLGSTVAIVGVSAASAA